ncbi:MAG: hypothetical protein ACR2MA_10405 [Egibacteraceae bacterium]
MSESLDLGSPDDLHNVDLELDPNEASGMTTVDHDDDLLERLGWHIGFWVVLDEGRVENCIALIGREQATDQPDEGWQVHRLQCEEQEEEFEDCESVARSGQMIYVFGSQFGSKDGPLQTKRHFIARFDESQITIEDGEPRVELEVAALPFRLHQMVNIALRERGIDLFPLGPESREEFITETRQEAIEDEEEWYWRIRYDDHPINIEGVTFRDDGSALLGLRNPVTERGNPIIVQLEHIEGFFERDAPEPVIEGVWTVDNLGSAHEYVGIRDLQSRGDTVELLVGNIEAVGEGSLILEEHPEGGTAVSTHWRAVFPTDRRGGSVTAQFIRGFGELTRVEGIAADADGRFFYVSDEDEKVKTRFMEV